MELDEGSVSDDVLTLAESLRRNGLVTSHGEAIHMAEQMLGKALGEKPQKIDLGIDQEPGDKSLRELVDIDKKRMPQEEKLAKEETPDCAKEDSEDADTIVFEADGEH